MSGIAGIINFDGAPVADGLIEAMTTTMAFRGPQGIRHWTGGSAALGHCLLCTTAEAAEDQQPLANESGSLLLVMDGWLSNRAELIERLELHRVIPRNHSDAELILKAYERWGEACLRYAEGDFALVIWSPERRQAWCARDRMGHKPFHYYWSGSTLAFASDLRPLLALPWVRQELNQNQLAEFLAWEWYSRDETLWQGIYRLQAAHHLSVTTGGLRSQKYWQPDVWASPLYSKDEDYIEHYRELFLDMVQRHSRSQAPLAVEVSGGLDSSAVLCAAEHLWRGGELPAPRIGAYSMYFQDDSPADEINYAREVGRYLDIAVREVPETDVPLTWFAEQARQSMDFPGFSNGAMGTGLRQAAAADGSRVILSGEGGDCWLEGCRAYYSEEFRQRRWVTLLQLARTDLAAYGPLQMGDWLLRQGIFSRLPAGLQKPLRAVVQAMRSHSKLEATDWLAPAMAEIIRQKRVTAGSERARRVQHLGQQQLWQTLDDPFSIQVTERLERHGASAGLEYRHPMNHHRFVEFAFTTPERLRLRGDRSKYIHVQALADLVSPAVLSRPDKAEFSHALRRDVTRMKEEVMNELCVHRSDWIVPAGIQQLLAKCDVNHDSAKPLWVLCGLYGCYKVQEESGRRFKRA